MTGRTGAGLGAATAGLGFLCVLAWWGDWSLAVGAGALVVLGVVSARFPASWPGHDAPAPSGGEPRALASLALFFPDPVILVDRRSVVVEANGAARAILPVLRDDQPLAFALRDPAVLDRISSVLSEDQTATVEFGGRTAAEPVYEVRLRPLPGGRDAPLGVAAVALFLRDQSAERRTERMRVDFVANVSHELRTPLASLSGFIDTLKGPAKDDAKARERFLDIMQAQAARMTRLIDDLLRLSRVELNEHVPPSARVDLVLTVAHMVEVLAPLARERRVDIRLDLPKTPIEVPGDRDELLRLAENLVENAIKYGGDGGHVDVSVHAESPPSGPGRVELLVRDYGPGIAPEHLPRLTERFYRVDAAESRKENGTGLGLAIVKHIVARHRGRLLIESEAGQGAAFRVQLPAAPTGPVT